MRSGSGWLYFIVGGLVVAVGFIGYLFYQEQSSEEVGIKLELPDGNEVGVKGEVEK